MKSPTPAHIACAAWLQVVHSHLQNDLGRVQVVLVGFAREVEAVQPFDDEPAFLQVVIGDVVAVGGDLGEGADGFEEAPVGSLIRDREGEVGESRRREHEKYLWSGGSGGG